MQLKNKAVAEKWIGAGERKLRQLESPLTCRSGSSLLDLPQVDLAGLTFAELAKATNGFAERNLVGCGGFGAVYRGVLADGSVVAVKKMLDPDPDRNLVPLRGCCIATDDIEEGKQRFLVYDFMPNGALEDFIYRDKDLHYGEMRARGGLREPPERGHGEVRAREDLSGRASLGEDLYQAITTEYIPIEEIFVSLSLKTEHSVLETINRLEGAVFAWNQRILEEKSKKSPGRHSWNFMKDSSSELDKMSVRIERVDTLVQLLKSRFPNLPPTFIDVLKVQYNMDIGHAVVEAYSRILFYYINIIHVSKR
nr:probable LRR receptor-like serine/threonine-protein kinase At5g45780 [Setaria viridis]